MYPKLIIVIVMLILLYKQFPLYSVRSKSGKIISPVKWIVSPIIEICYKCWKSYCPSHLLSAWGWQVFWTLPLHILRHHQAEIKLCDLWHFRSVSKLRGWKWLCGCIIEDEIKIWKMFIVSGSTLMETYFALTKQWFSDNKWNKLTLYSRSVQWLISREISC